MGDNWNNLVDKVKIMDVSLFNKDGLLSNEPAAIDRRRRIQDSAIRKMDHLTEVQLGIIAVFLKCPYLMFRYDAICYLMNGWTVVESYPFRELCLSEDELQYLMDVVRDFVDGYLTNLVDFDEAIMRHLPQSDPNEEVTDTIASIWMLNHRRANKLENATDEVRAEMLTVDCSYRRLRISDLDDRQLEMLTICVLCYNPCYNNYTFYSYILNLASDEDEFVTEEDIRTMVLIIVEVISRFDHVNRHCINYVLTENYRVVTNSNPAPKGGLECLCPSALEWLLLAALDGFHATGTLGQLTDSLNGRLEKCQAHVFTDDEVALMCDQITTICRLHLQFDHCSY